MNVTELGIGIFLFETLEYSRNPVLLSLSAELSNFPFEAMPMYAIGGNIVSRIHGVEFALYCKNKHSGEVDPKNGYSVINPDNDLAASEQTFVKLTRNYGWPSATGRAPSLQEFQQRLSKCEVYVYSNKLKYSFLQNQTFSNMRKVLMGLSNQANCVYKE